jgi:hypothetical protein
LIRTVFRSIKGRPNKGRRTDVLAVVALVVAVYGAGLSTWSAVRDAGRDTPRLDVRITYPNDFSGVRCFDRFIAKISIINKGQRRFVVNDLALVYETGVRDFVHSIPYGGRETFRDRSGVGNPLYDGDRLPASLDSGDQAVLRVNLLTANHESVKAVRVSTNLAGSVDRPVRIPRAVTFRGLARPIRPC